MNTFKFYNFNQYLLIYMIFINLISFILYGIDKFCAIRHIRRIRVVTLLSLAVIGGSIGSILGMYIFNHKTKQKCFYLGIPLIMIIETIILIYIK